MYQLPPAEKNKHKIDHDLGTLWFEPEMNF